MDTLDLQTGDDKPKVKRESVSKWNFAVEFVWTPEKPPQKPTAVADATTSGAGTAASAPTTAGSAKTAPATGGRK
jgi:hypothetical protein